jgi:hypothetical protein
MLHFNSSDKVAELIAWGSGLTDPESRLILDQAIVTGRGGTYLSLTREQYIKLMSIIETTKAPGLQETLGPLPFARRGRKLTLHMLRASHHSHYGGYGTGKKSGIAL